MTRNVERGSYIISTPSTTKIILQILPRGNIEIIYPLALTIPYCIKKLILQEKKYLVSFICMRKWKINFNLLVDCDILMNMQPDDDNDSGLVKLFVTQLIENNKLKDNQKIDYLNLFIATLTTMIVLK